MGINISILDGCKCIGGNKILVGFDGRNILFDFGTNFTVSGAYYDSFLKQRDVRGIFDQIEMGLLPRLRIYREELVTDDYRSTYGSFPELKVDALFISHAHMDHIGMAGFLDLDIPFVANPMTAVLMKCIEDTGTGFGCENAYVSDRVCHDGSTLQVPTKERDGRKDGYLGRNIVLTEHSKGCSSFMAERPTKNKEICGGGCLSTDHLGMETKCFPVDHSIYGAAAHAINSDDGWIVYSGDVRKHGVNREDTERFVEGAAKLRPKVLIIEGTRTSRPDNTEDGSLTEDQVAANCLAACQDAKGLIVADFGARNFERLEIFADIAKRIGRELVITPKDAFFLDSIGLADGIDHLDGLRIFDGNRSDRNDHQESMIRKKRPDQFISPERIRDNKEGYVLCFSVWEMPNLLDIRPEGGTFIYSGSGSFDESADFDFGRLDNWLRKLGMNAVGFVMEPIESHRGREILVPRFVGDLHASGHASKEELVEMIERISPEYLIPVHTTNPEYFLEHVTCVPEKKILITDEGKRMNIK